MKANKRSTKRAEKSRPVVPYEHSDNAKRQQRTVLKLVRENGFYGATYKEVCALLGLHHGQASGALSNLHKAGLLSRLTLRRNRCSVYVVPQSVHERDTIPHGNKTDWRKRATEAEDRLLTLEDASNWRDRAESAEQKLAEVKQMLKPSAVTMTYPELMHLYSKVRASL